MRNLRFYISVVLLSIVSLTSMASDIKGDLDGDGKLTMADVSVLSDILVGKTNSSFPSSQLDFNADGSVSIGDLTKLIDMVANSTEGGVSVGIEGWDNSGEDWVGVLSAPSRKTSNLILSCGEAAILADDVAALPVALVNSTPVNAFLMTVKVPDGLSFIAVNSTYCKLARNSSKSVVDCNLTADGNLNVIAYSTDNATFSGSDGDILLVYVNATIAKDYALGVFDAEFSDVEFNTLYAEDVISSASTIIRTIFYYVDDELYQTQTFEYGATVTPLPAPEKDGYTFSGWSEIPTTMPAHDVIVYAAYETGITDLMMEEQSVVRIYSPNGKLLNRLQRGINIVVMSDESVRKVFVK